ncbi:hypothetical protein AFI02nite_14130 [Aliivibrio fischeri]|uniref:Uncharacterized protein n=1 Tax=Aliivibrio fischeri TaxID=668 RepID=A0A510UFN2_ALIFS|nr:hypothetical protein AFI02nite_14130 [Aliivibrio fischeri]
MPQPIIPPVILKISMLKASNQNETNIPEAEAKNCKRIDWLFVEDRASILLNFIPKTGSTQGIILRIKPPSNAIPIMLNILFDCISSAGWAIAETEKSDRKKRVIKMIN